MSGAKRKCYSGAFQLMPLLKFLVKIAGRESGICEKKIAQDRVGLQSMPLSFLAVSLSPQLRTSLAWPSSPAELVAMGALFSVWLSVRLHSSNYRAFQKMAKFVGVWGVWCGAVITLVRIIHWQIR